MKRTNHPTIWAKRALCLLALAATASLILPACDKNKIDEEPIVQHDEVIYYYYNNNYNLRYSPDTVHKYDADERVRYIYITVKDGEKFTSCQSDHISFHRREIQFAMKESSKCRGRGNFMFEPGQCTYGDSLDFVAMGFTVNQQNL